jgi:hypothetical protein
MSRLEWKLWSEEQRKRDKQQKIFNGIKVISLVRTQLVYLLENM